MTLSVLVSCHNYRDFVVEAIESALAQTLPPAEVIVIDDGSTDGSGELLQERYGNHPVVKVIRTENRGQMATFVTGFRASRGDIVCFLDADDRFKPTYLARVADVYRAHRTVDQVFCNVRQFGTSTELWLTIPRDEDLGTAALRVWATQNYYGVPTSGVSVRRALCKQILDLPESFYPAWRIRADDCLIFGAQQLGAHRYFVAEPLVEYRAHGRNRWSGRTFTAVEMAQHRYHLTRLLDWYNHIAKIDARTLAWAFLEFRTKPRPRPGDFLLYLWLQFRAPMPWRAKALAVGRIARHYILSLWKIKPLVRWLLRRT